MLDSISFFIAVVLYGFELKAFTLLYKKFIRAKNVSKTLNLFAYTK